MDELLQKVKDNLILSHDEDDELLRGYIRAAVSYAESYGFFFANRHRPVPQGVRAAAFHHHPALYYGLHW